MIKLIAWWLLRRRPKEVLEVGAVLTINGHRFVVEHVSIQRGTHGSTFNIDGRDMTEYIERMWVRGGRS
jgi:hypothetical protein